MRLDDRVCSGWFAVEQGPSPRVRARAPPVQRLLRGGYKRSLHRFKADKGIMDALVHLRKQKGGGGAGGSNCWRVSPGNAALGHALR